MSADITADLWNVNGGITLPKGQDATYNIELAPLFFERSGAIAKNTHVFNGVSSSGEFWSNTTRGELAYWLTYNADVVYPSHRDDRAHAFSLRCLVSTKSLGV